MATDESELEPIEPETARELFLDHEANNCAGSTVYNHRYHLNSFLEWYERNGRHDLPWREPEWSAFELLIAKIPLRKTGATAVSATYVPQIARYPTPEAVVAASVDEIEDRISSLGLAKRAGYVRRRSGQLLARHAGNVPCDRSELLDLLGVEEYTKSTASALHGKSWNRRIERTSWIARARPRRSSSNTCRPE